jgi:glycosyltransferase involved in cell wall biosynthesis
LKVLVNASTLVVGGGAQVGISFIEYVLKNPLDDMDLIFVVSEKIYNNLKVNLKGVNIHISKKSPARPITGYSTRKFIRVLESEFKPDVVYSLGFPSYINFKTREVGRYTNPWEINLGQLPWHLLEGHLDKIIVKTGIIYRQMWAKNAAVIETQTNAAKLGIVKRLRYKEDNVVVVPNSVNSLFFENFYINIDEKFKTKTIFCLAAPYPHKNLGLIPYVASFLKFELKMPVRFILTLPIDNPIWCSILRDASDLKVLDCIENVGVLDLEQCREFYAQASLVFLPTLLEVFSATYIESIVMNTPIITTDLDFARDICSDCALYFKYSDPVDAAKKIYAILTDANLYTDLVQHTKKQKDLMVTMEEKYKTIFKMLREVKEGRYT